MTSIRNVLAAAGLALLLCFPGLVGAGADILGPAAVPGSVVDLSPLLVQVVDLAIVVGAPALGTLALAILFRFQRLMGLRTTAERDFETRAKVDQALFHAAAYARQRAKALGGPTVDVGSADIAAGARYAMQSIPDTLKRLGITDAASERLKDMVEARLGTPTS